MTGPAVAQADEPAQGYRWVLLGGVWLLYFAFGPSF